MELIIITYYFWKPRSFKFPDFSMRISDIEELLIKKNGNFKKVWFSKNNKFSYYVPQQISDFSYFDIKFRILIRNKILMKYFFSN